MVIKSVDVVNCMKYIHFMVKILKEKGFNDLLPGQKLCRQCVTEYEKLTKPPENENMT